MQGVLPSACNGIDNSDWGRPICSVCLAIFKLPLPGRAPGLPGGRTDLKPRLREGRPWADEGGCRGLTWWPEGT